MGRTGWRRARGWVVVAGGVALALPGCAAGAPAGQTVAGVTDGPRLSFRATAPEFEAATEEYRALWAAEGERMISALLERSGMRFPVDAVDVQVMESASWAGTDRMGMRASYPPETKRGTLVHELGHILVGTRVPRGPDGEPVVDEHRVLFLFLYDAWVDVWGREFADGQVVVESRRRGLVDYEGIWRAVLSLSAEERAAELRGLLAAWGSA